VTVTFSAGYDVGYVPERLRVAIKMLTADLYEHPEAQVEMRLEKNTMLQRLLYGLTIEEVF
jgi:hypothetical protein